VVTPASFAYTKGKGVTYDRLSNRSFLAITQSYSDQQIIEGLRSGGAAEDRSLRYVYQQHRERIVQFVVSKNGSEAEGKDIFQEGLLVLYKQIKQDKFRGESALGTYIFSICKYLWFHKLKKGLSQKS